MILILKEKKETGQTCRDGIPIKAAMLEIISLRSSNMSHGRSPYFKLQPTEPVLGPATLTLMMWSSNFCSHTSCEPCVCCNSVCYIP